jgi:hypothetical protein
VLHELVFHVCSPSAAVATGCSVDFTGLMKRILSY